MFSRTFLHLADNFDHLVDNFDRHADIPMWLNDMLYAKVFFHRWGVGTILYKSNHDI